MELGGCNIADGNFIVADGVRDIAVGVCNIFFGGYGIFFNKSGIIIALLSLIDEQYVLFDVKIKACHSFMFL